MKIEQEVKIEMYDLGLYSMPVPPVTTAKWTKENWIDFIDNNGKWHLKAWAKHHNLFQR